MFLRLFAMPCSITETVTEVEEALAEDMGETMEGDMVEATEEGISTGE